MYAYVNMLGRIDNCSNKLTRYLPERKEIAANLHLREVNDSFGKGFHALKAHVLNCSMTGLCPHKSLQLWPKFHLLFSTNSFNLKKCATFKGLK